MFSGRISGHDVRHTEYLKKYKKDYRAIEPLLFAVNQLNDSDKKLLQEICDFLTIILRNDMALSQNGKPPKIEIDYSYIKCLIGKVFHLPIDSQTVIEHTDALLSIATHTHESSGNGYTGTMKLFLEVEGIFDHQEEEKLNTLKNKILKTIAQENPQSLFNFNKYLIKRGLLSSNNLSNLDLSNSNLLKIKNLHEIDFTNALLDPLHTQIHWDNLTERQKRSIKLTLNFSPDAVPIYKKLIPYNVEAFERLSYFCHAGLPIAKDEQDAKDILKVCEWCLEHLPYQDYLYNPIHAVNKKIVSAANVLLASIYKRGIQGIHIDTDKAIYIYQQEKDHNKNSYAMIYIGDCYREKEELQVAVDCYKQASDLGNTFGHLKYANMLMTGDGVPKNQKLAKQILQRAIVAKNPIALTVKANFINLYPHSNKEKQGLFKELCQMKKLGSITNAIYLGNCYKKGIGTAVNINKAREIFSEVTSILFNLHQNSHNINKYFAILTEIAQTDLMVEVLTNVLNTHGYIKLYQVAKNNLNLEKGLQCPITLDLITDNDKIIVTENTKNDKKHQFVFHANGIIPWWITKQKIHNPLTNTYDDILITQ